MTATNDVKHFQIETIKLGSRVVRKIAFDAFTAIAMRTPVDTGHARRNWRVMIGGPGDMPPDNPVPNPNDKRAGTKQKHASPPADPPPDPAELAKIGDWKPGKVIFMFNNVPYIVPLEHGHSSQNPPGHGIVGPVMTALEAWASSDGGGAALETLSPLGEG